MRRKEKPKPEIHSLDDALDWLRHNTIGCDHIIEFLEDYKRQRYELLPLECTDGMAESAERYALNARKDDFCWEAVWNAMVTTARYERGLYERQDPAQFVSSG